MSGSPASHYSNKVDCQVYIYLLSQEQLSYCLLDGLVFISMHSWLVIILTHGGALFSMAVQLALFDPEEVAWLCLPLGTKMYVFSFDWEIEGKFWICLFNHSAPPSNDKTTTIHRDTAKSILKKHKGK